MRRYAWVLVLSTGCFAGYDSRWGDSKNAQRAHAQKNAPTLAGEPSTAPPGDARVLKVRALVTRSFTVSVADTPRYLRELFEDASDVTEPTLGVRLTLDRIASWELGNDDDLRKALEAARSTDAGDDVDFVVGFVGSLPKASVSFHDLGMGQLPGRHVVVRAPSSAERTDALEAGYQDLPEDERQKIRKSHRRHRAATVFLHELGHTLGAIHEKSATSVMLPHYSPKQTTFSQESALVMRAVLEHRDVKTAPEMAKLATELAALYRAAAPGVFVEEERTQMVANLEQTAAKNTARAAPPPSPAPPAAKSSPPIEVPELSAEDQARFARASEHLAAGRHVAAWEEAKPLFTKYPGSVAVQDYRCKLATSVLPFAAARRECDRIMQLSIDTK